MKLKLLVSPLAKGAFFASYLDVARAEFRACFPEADSEVQCVGGLDFLETDLPESPLSRLARLSFVQGVFRDEGDPRLAPLDVQNDFLLPDELVFGAKYRGKTNEMVTQLAINLGLQFRLSKAPARSLLDPMAGRGTTLLWALRYGLNGTGIEQDPSAAQDLHRHLKKQSKLHRIKHSHEEGFVGKKNKKGLGRFAQYEMAGHSLRFVTGDSRQTPQLVGGKRFDLIVSDLPYGVQFKGSVRRNPLDVVRDCAEGWLVSLHDGGVMVLVFNRYQPKRDDLADVFASLGGRIEDFSAPHRMSESIVRDLLVVTRQRK